MAAAAVAPLSSFLIVSKADVRDVGFVTSVWMPNALPPDAWISLTTSL